MLLILKLLAMLGWVLFRGEGQSPETYAQEHPCTAIVWRYDEAAGWRAYIPGRMAFLSDADFGPALRPTILYWAWCGR